MTSQGTGAACRTGDTLLAPLRASGMTSLACRASWRRAKLVTTSTSSRVADSKSTSSGTSKGLFVLSRSSRRVTWPAVPESKHAAVKDERLVFVSTHPRQPSWLWLHQTSCDLWRKHAKASKLLTWTNLTCLEWRKCGFILFAGEINFHLCEKSESYGYVT